MSDDFKGQSPWGAPPGGGGSGNGSGRGPTPPNIDELIRDLQDKIKKFLPGGKSSGGKSISLILLVLVFDGIHTFQPIHAEPLVLASLGASAADASELFAV